MRYFHIYLYPSYWTDATNFRAHAQVVLHQGRHSKGGMDGSPVAEFLNRTLYLTGMWFSEDQPANIVKTHV